MSGIIDTVGSKSGVIGTTELDYEEGEWTPTFVGWTTNTGNTFTCKYTKIGNVCLVILSQAGGTLDPGGTEKYIGGLPFVSAGAGPSGVMSEANLVSGNNPLCTLSHGGGSGFTCIQDFGSETNIRLSLTYITV